MSYHIRLTLVLSLFTLFGINLTGQNFVIKSYDIDVKVMGGEARFDVTETITVDFLIPRRGIIRNIPYAYKLGGEWKTFGIKNISVDGEEYKVSSQNDQKIIRIGDPNITLTGLHTYILRYTVDDAFIFAEDHTEFYWNLIGGQWKTNIEKVSYHIALDKALPMTANDYVVYTGTVGHQDTSTTINYYMGTFEGMSTRNLQAGEGITVAINLPKDYVKRPGKLEMLWQKYGFAGIGGLLLALISGFFYNTWRKYGKDVPIIKAVKYTPPKELNPSEVGVLIDERADNIDIIALLPYWAHQGLIHIKRIPKNWGKDDHQLIKIKELPAEAHPFEKIIFDGLFQSADTVLISDLKESFYEYMSSAKVSLKSHLNTMGVYYPVSMKMQTTAAMISGGLVALAILSFILFQSILLSAAFALSAAIGFIFSYFMLKKNELGIRLYQDVVGFKMFVKAAEKDKIERMLKEDPEYFEKTLPYAMVFGYAKQWSKKFDGLLLEPPKWYLGPHGGMYYGSSVFSPGEFGTTFSNDIQDMQQVFTSTPSTQSGGGGFSGGGSVGGGFGGGGGDSW